jgi:hypothetical protein
MTLANPSGSRTLPLSSEQAGIEARGDDFKLTHYRNELPLRRRERKERQRQLRGADAVNVVASWGAAIRSRAAGSQDELRRSAIHKQRPYPG